MCGSIKECYKFGAVFMAVLNISCGVWSILTSLQPISIEVIVALTGGITMIFLGILLLLGLIKNSGRMILLYMFLQALYLTMCTGRLILKIEEGSHLSYVIFGPVTVVAFFVLGTATAWVLLVMVYQYRVEMVDQTQNCEIRNEPQSEEDRHIHM